MAQSTITGNIADIAGLADRAEVVFRPAGPTANTLSARTVRVKPGTDGSFSKLLNPGPMTVEIFGKLVPFTVPDDGGTYPLYGRIVANLSIPPSTPADVIAAAVASYIAGGTFLTPAAGDTRYAPASGIAKTALASGVQTSLDKADAALTPAVAATTYAPRWAGSTAYDAVTPVILPNGQIGKRTSAGTSRPSFDATELAAWTISAGAGSGVSVTDNNNGTATITASGGTGTVTDNGNGTATIAA